MRHASISFALTWCSIDEAEINAYREHVLDGASPWLSFDHMPEFYQARSIEFVL